MSGVWTFSPNGVMRVVENPLAVRPEDSTVQPAVGSVPRPKILVYRATNEKMASFEQLEQKLAELGWKRYFNEAYYTPLRQYHTCPASLDLITLPPFFEDIRSTHMYDIVVKTRSAFQVQDT
jgi:hypothetical protein